MICEFLKCAKSRKSFIMLLNCMNERMNESRKEYDIQYLNCVMNILLLYLIC